MCATACESRSTCFFKSPHLLKINPGGGVCRTGPMAWLAALGPQNLEVDEDVRWDPPPRIIRPKERSVRLWSNMGYWVLLAATAPFPHVGELLCGGTCSRAVGW